MTNGKAAASPSGRRAATPAPGRSGRPAVTGARVDGIVSSIGPKLQQLRQHQRLSLQQLAARADVSAAAIHKIERNGMVPTITTLLKIAAALEHPVGYFIDGEDGAPELAALTPAGERPAVFTPHRGLHLAGISGPYAHFRGAAAEATVDPGSHSGDKPLLHPGEETGAGHRGRPDLRRGRAAVHPRAGRLPALHRRPAASLGQRGRDEGPRHLVRARAGRLAAGPGSTSWTTTPDASCSGPRPRAPRPSRARPGPADAADPVRRRVRGPRRRRRHVPVAGGGADHRRGGGARGVASSRPAGRVPARRSPVSGARRRRWGGGRSESHAGRRDGRARSPMTAGSQPSSPTGPRRRHPPAPSTSSRTPGIAAWPRSRRWS